MASPPIKSTTPLAFQWPGLDPFIFCVHHYDRYGPSAANSLGPDRKQLVGRDLGMDFSGKDGWSMYHGTEMAGFPKHPHSGFETITLVRKGLVDHTDSTGATARYGKGDLMWVTTGAGVCHSEVFPLVNTASDNHMELFQIWINLPEKSKMAPPSFSMAWANEQPRRSFGGEPGKQTHVLVAGGELAGLRGPAPPPDSWASDARSHVALATIRMDPGASWVLPRVEQGAGEEGAVNRMLYFFEGRALRVGGEREFRSKTGVELAHDRDVLLENVGGDVVEALLLQGRPIAEPVVQRGPFVATSQAKLRDMMARYQATEFGSWPFKTDEPANPREQGRFAKYPDGRVTAPDVSREAAAAERKEEL